MSTAKPAAVTEPSDSRAVAHGISSRPGVPPFSLGTWVELSSDCGLTSNEALELTRPLSTASCFSVFGQALPATSAESRAVCSYKHPSWRKLNSSRNSETRGVAGNAPKSRC